MLHEETARRVQELFHQKVCCRCRQPAQRIWKGSYYCPRCFPGSRRAEVRVHRAARQARV
jgi:predicted amidophosphoribosyltransferase